jgi:hypothetical protein
MGTNRAAIDSLVEETKDKELQRNANKKINDALKIYMIFLEKKNELRDIVDFFSHLNKKLIYFQ